SGNSYVTGFFYGRAIFGLGEANETTLTSAGVNIQSYGSGGGSNDIFVAKYNAGGALLWVKQAGGDSDDHGRAIAVEGGGNSYVTGYAGGSLFVAKYDPTGALLWTKRADGVPTDEAATVLGSGRGLDIGVDGSGNSYITGSFTGDATFGPDEPNETMLTSAGNWDIFMAKFEPAGALGWAGRAGGASDDYGRGIAVHESGNSYVTGDFSGAATFGQGETHETTLTSAGQVDIFVANFDPSGALLWASRDGGTSDDYGRGIGVDGSGNSYVTGDFTGRVTFGTTPAIGLRAVQTTETILTSIGASDIFLAKYGADVVLPVTLGYYRADRDRDALTFHWQTVTESGTAGFNILAVMPEGRTLLNSELIPSTVIDAVMPIDYRFGVSGNAAL
ncbi:MAG: SBBP repeat-containing protein, partial [Caldilineaceae bacterium]|nr:SBBP repeat-containing protein [Caldilineaceae bacterium]